MPTVRRWWGGGAGFLSALLHGLLAALLLWRVRAPKIPESVSLVPIAIELSEVVRPRPALARPAPVADRAEGYRRESTGAASPRTAPRAVDARSEDAPRDDLSASAPDRRSALNPVGSSTIEIDRGPVRTPDLSFGALAHDLQSRLAAAPSDATLRIGAHKPSLDQLRAESERQEDAVANVEAGRADPLLYDYLRGARVRLEDEAKRIAERLPVGAGQTLRGWGRGLVQRVEELHRGDPIADRVRPDLRDAAEQRRPDLAAAYDENRRQAEAGAEIRRAEICLDVAPGHDTTTRLRHGSGNAALDRLAVDAFTRAVSVQPVPLDARTGCACYEVRISAYRAGPAPSLSCDLNFFGAHGPTCVWPLKKITTVTSRLLSVEYPAGTGAAGNQSLLRSAR